MRRFFHEYPMLRRWILIKFRPKTKAMSEISSTLSSWENWFNLRWKFCSSSFTPQKEPFWCAFMENFNFLSFIILFLFQCHAMPSSSWPKCTNFLQPHHLIMIYEFGVAASFDHHRSGSGSSNPRNRTREAGVRKRETKNQFLDS